MLIIKFDLDSIYEFDRSEDWIKMYYDCILEILQAHH
jgi:hypothetical protein